MTKIHLKSIALLITLALCLSAASCSASSKSDGNYAASREANGVIYDDGYAMDEESYDLNGAAYSDEYKSSSATVRESGTGADNPAGQEDKIIRTANITMESDDAQTCYDTLLAFARQNGGSELSVRKSHDNYGNYNYFNIDATLKITPDKLEEFIKLAEKTDKVTNAEITSDDVTREYYDVKIRLESKKAALDNYYKLLKNAKNVSESLEVQRYITDLTAEIESMEGTLRYYDAKVDLSTINLSIQQRDKLPAQIEDEFHWDSLSISDVGKLMKNGFLGMINFLWSLLLWILIAIVVLSPLALIGLVIFFIVRHYRKKHPKAPKTPKNAAPYAPPVYTPAAPQQSPDTSDGNQ
ncbi:MAG: DUF4349 domain-containing protein [Clostridia bacterium]|nr:DUF4349 domain-containing protein [Clostridia bacterium]